PTLVRSTSATASPLRSARIPIRHGGNGPAGREEQHLPPRNYEGVHGGRTAPQYAGRPLTHLMQRSLPIGVPDGYRTSGTTRGRGRKPPSAPPTARGPAGTRPPGGHPVTR